MLFGQAQRVDLNTIAKTPHLRVAHPVALAADFIPKIHKGAHFAHFSDKTDAGVHEKADPPDHLSKMFFGHFAFEVVQNRSCCCEGEGQLLLWCRAGLLQMVRADVHRIPLGQMRARVSGDICDHPQGRLGRTDIGASAQVFLNDIILHSALQRADIGALFIGRGNIKRQQPGCCGIDGHGGVHLIKWDICK